MLVTQNIIECQLSPSQMQRCQGPKFAVLPNAVSSQCIELAQIRDQGAKSEQRVLLSVN